MKVSVIVPVYNVEKYLSKCLDSLANQTIDDYEVIVVNDGTPDNSQEIIDRYVSKYSNFKSFIKKNGGLSDARNYGLKYATGQFVSFVDSDDYIKEDMLEKMYVYAFENNLDIVVCDTIVKSDNNEYVLNSNLHYSASDIKNYILSYPMACTRLVRKKIMDNFSFRKGTLYEDLDLTPSYVTMTNKVGFLEYAGYYYVQRSGSIMNQKEFNEKLLDIFTVLDNNYQKLFKEYPEEIEYLYITHLLRTASLRFLDYPNTETYLSKINNMMKKRFPNWKENIYLKKSGFKIKLICNLAYNKHYKILKILKKLSGRG